MAEEEKESTAERAKGSPFLLVLRADEAEEAQIKSLAQRPRVPGVTIGECMGSRMSWEQTLARSQRSACDGFVEAVWRCLLMHVLQPEGENP